MATKLSSSWRRMRLGDLLKQVNRFEPIEANREYRLLGVKWYAGGVFERQCKLGKFIAAKSLNRVEEGDFIYNRLFAWKGSFAVVANGFEGGYVSNEFPIFRARSDLIIEKFLYIYFSRPQVWKRIEHQSTGTTSISRNRWLEEEFLSWYISLPPINEQWSIINTILAIDEAIQSNKDVLDRARNLKKALIHQLLTFGIPGRHSNFKLSSVGTIPQDWKVQHLAALATIQTGLAKNKERHLKGSLTVPYLRVANVQDGYIDGEIKRICVTPEDIIRYGLRSGDVLLTEGGDNDKLGRGCVWDGRVSPCLHQNHIFAVRCNSNLLSKFLALYTASAQGRRYFLDASKQTTNLASINSSQLKAMPIPIPETAEQQRICELVESVEIYLRGALGVLALLSEVKDRLTSRLFAGQGSQGETLEILE